MIKKITIIRDNNKPEGFIAKTLTILSSILTLFLFMVAIFAVLYLAIITSVFLIAILLAAGVVSFIIMKFRKKRKYYKMN